MCSCVLMSLVHFSNGLLVLFLLVSWSSLYIKDVLSCEYVFLIIICLLTFMFVLFSLFFNQAEVFGF